MNDNIPHGTPSGYGFWGCRCDRCKVAHAIAQRRYRYKKAGRALPKQKYANRVTVKAQSPPESCPAVLTPAHRWSRESGWHIPNLR